MDNTSNKFRQRKIKFEHCFNSVSPYPQYPIPFLLEHLPKIVGWCKLWEENNKLLSEGIITDSFVRKQINLGKIKGASVTGIAKVSKCSICNSEYVDCNHIAGDFYEGTECTNRVFEADLVEASLVKRPVNKECLMGLK